ncbi:flagellar biosynthesis protein FlhB [bacterium]|nr:flagellar biosynthesis protein FlhB [bacterium]
MADQDKTHQPTSHKKRKARQQGNVAKSQELCSAAVLIAGIGALTLLGPGMVDQISWAFRTIYTDLLYLQITPDVVSNFFKLGVFYMLKLLSPFILTVLSAGLMINYVQHGFLFTTKPLQPRLDKLDPVKNIKNKFGIRGFVELVKGLFKVSVVAFVAYMTIKSEILNFAILMDKSVPFISSEIAISILKLGMKLAIAILVLGIIDWKFQQWKHNKDLMMSKQEVKDEHKMMEGDPKLKAKMRRTQFRMSYNRMIKDIPEADVIIANPVHIAVALKYNPETMSAPKVVAKGKRKLAEKIKSVARKHDIPIIEDPPLARSLYRSAEIGWEIPYELFQAVAEVLALVYRMKEAA